MTEDHTEVDRVLAAFAPFTERQRLSEDNSIALHLQQQFELVDCRRDGANDMRLDGRPRSIVKVDGRPHGCFADRHRVGARVVERVHGSERVVACEVTVGYEVPRASSLRVFVEANATLPFYNVESTRTTYSRTPSYVTTSVSSHRYAPSVVVSLGLGWQRNGRF